MEKKILFLDLDGTLLNDEKKVTPGNRLTIKEALARGHRVAIASGRPLESALEQARRAGLAGEGCFVIAYNGGNIYDCTAGELILRRTLELEDVYRIYDEAERRGLYIQTYDRGDVVIEPRCDERNTERYCALSEMTWRRIGDIRRDLSAPPVKVLMIDFQDRAPLDDMARWLREEMGERVECFFSSSCFMEVVPAGTDKGTAVTGLCRQLGIDIRNAIAAGDENNDIPMIRAAGVGVAMANGIQEAKDAADYITERDNNHDAIEEIIRKFLL